MSPDEKVELAELLAYRTRSVFDIRRDRLVAAEMRLGMWENGKFTGWGLAELLARARRHDGAAREGNDTGDRFSSDEFTVLNFGFRNRHEIEAAADSRREAETTTEDSMAQTTLSFYPC